MAVLQRVESFLHKHFLIVLLLAYLAAGICPVPGLWLRSISFFDWPVGGGQTLKASLAIFMLALLLFNAGLGVKARQMTQLFNRPLLLIVALVANLLMPVVLFMALGHWLALWHNNDELQNLLVGVALIAAMPVAGSSTAWAQNSNGNMSLSLGLVFFSTIFSPLTTPAVLNIFGGLTKGDYSDDLHELACQGTNVFMALTVVIPSILGILVHLIFGDDRISRIKPHLKLTNYILLLLLNYSNACTSLPQVIAKPDWDFLAFVLVTTVTLCVICFSLGGLLSRMFRVNESERASLMFGLGMNNNGTGLVLASVALADHQAVMLPMIAYTLGQQVIAAIVSHRFFSAVEHE